jgi:peptide/nickel transport system substrate-binding protein
MKKLLYATALAGTFASAGLPALAQDEVAITVNMVQIIGSIDPAKVSDYTEYMAAVNLYDGLTTVDPDGNVIPQLAESWEISDDDLTYTFRLKPDATFTDGSPVTAADVVYSVQRLMAIQQGASYLFEGIVEPDAVVALDDHTVEFTLTEVYSPFIAVTPLIFVVNQNAVTTNDDDIWGEAQLAETPLGAGPFTLQSWTRGSEMVLRRNADYHAGWAQNRPIDEVRLVVTRDESTVRALARRGELGLSSQYQSTETYDGIAAQDDYRLIEAATATGYYLKLNNQLAPTDDIHVRRAIALATDYETIRNVLYPGSVMTGPLASAFADAVPTDATAPVFDLEAARAELEQSPYFTGAPIDLVHTYVANTAFQEEIALLLTSNLEQIGFRVTIQPEPWNRVTELATSIETTPHFSQVFYGPTYPSPDSVFYVQYHSDAAGSWASMDWVNDPEVDAMIDASRLETDPDARNAIYRDIGTKLTEDQRSVWLLAQQQRHAVHVCLEGFAWVPMQSVEFDFSRYSWTCD